MQNFNKSNITHYSKLMQDLWNSFKDLPPEHMWNMNEKGIQLDGGHKNNRKKYYPLHTHKVKNFYWIKSDNLELVTVVECISASGVAMPPSFVLSDGPTLDCTDIDNIGRGVGMNDK